MDKLSIFDFITFFVPGVTLLLLFLWALNAFDNTLLTNEKYPTELLLIIAILPCYLTGILLNFIALKMEQIFNKGKKDTWVQILENNAHLADKLNAISIAKFEIPFKQDGKIDTNGSGRFYDLAYQILEVEGKLDKTKILYSQYRLFSNGIPLGILSLLLVLIVTVKDVYMLKTCCYCDSSVYTKELIEALFIATFSILTIFLGLKFYPMRRAEKMRSTLELFYAYSLTNKL